MSLKVWFIAALLSLPLASSSIRLPKLLKKSFLCKICQRTEDRFLKLIKSSQKGVIDLVLKFCRTGASPEGCEYFVKNKAELLLPLKILFIKETDYFCSQKFKFCDPKVDKFSQEAFRRSLYARYPPIQVPKVEGVLKFRAVVLSDIHVQQKYLFKASKDCPEQVGCCDAKSGIPELPELQAGYWGAPNSMCDIPPYTFEKAVQLIKEKEIDADALFVLGDLSSHDFVYQNEDMIEQTNRYVLDTLKGNFSIPIVPVLGNHECNPIDYFNWDDPNSFVRRKIFPIYSRVISSEQISELVNDGFFVQEFPKHNLKVVSFNTQLGDIFNDYLTKNATNPLGCLAKLAKTFSESEKKGQKVLILTHIPISDLFISRIFSRSLQTIFERFRNIFSGMFSAHMHLDQLKFLKDKEGEIYGLNFISPSLTTFSSYRPSYRVYTFEEGKVLDYEQFNIDIDFFNKRALEGNFDLKFELAYTFRKEYQVSSNTPQDFASLYRRFLHKKGEFAERYLRNHFTQPLSDMEKQRNFVICSIENDYDLMAECLKRLDPYNWIDLFSSKVYRFFFENDWFYSKEQLQDSKAKSKQN